MMDFGTMFHKKWMNHSSRIGLHTESVLTGNFTRPSPSSPDHGICCKGNASYLSQYGKFQLLVENHYVAIEKHYSNRQIT